MRQLTMKLYSSPPCCWPRWPRCMLPRRLLVEKGVPRAEIVVAEKRPRMVTLAALELRHFVQKMSGARLPIVTAPTAGAQVKIHVGQSAETDRLGVTAEGLRDGAYRIVSGPGWLVLIGKDRDFDSSKMPWPLSRKDVPRAAAEWAKATAGKTDAAWGFPFASGFKAFWNPKDFTAQMTARYGEDFAALWKTNRECGGLLAPRRGRLAQRRVWPAAQSRRPLVHARRTRRGGPAEGNDLRRAAATKP